MIQYPAEKSGGKKRTSRYTASSDILSSYFNPDENLSALCQVTFSVRSEQFGQPLKRMFLDGTPS